VTNVAAAPPPTTLLGTTTGTQIVAVLDANPALAHLDPGGIVEGVVVGRDARGQTVIETAFGQISFSSRLNLAIGSKVVLEIQSTGARLAAIVLSVDGQPVALLARASAAPLPPLPDLASPPGRAAASLSPSTPLESAPVTEVTLSTGVVATATLLQPASPARVPSVKAESAPAAVANSTSRPPSSAPASSPSRPAAAIFAGGGAHPALPPAFTAAPLPAGSRFSVRIAAIEPPASQPGDTAAPPPPMAAGPIAFPAIGERADPPGDHPPEPQPPGASLPAVTGARTPPALRGNAAALEGVVIGRDGNGQTAIQTPLGIVELPLPSEPLAGSRIVLELLGPPQLPQPAPESRDGGEVIGLSRAWPALREAVAALADGAADPAHPPFSGLPRPGDGLALGILRFAAALENGESAIWLDDATARQLAARDSGALASRIADDFAHLAALASEGGSGEWRAFFIPVWSESQLFQLRLFLRREQARPDAGAAKAASTGRRFIIELDLDRLGAMQLDAFVKGRRLSLILRSHRPLPRALREELADIFASANAAAGLDGTLGFEEGLARFPLAPIDSLRRLGASESVVV